MRYHVSFDTGYQLAAKPPVPRDPGCRRGEGAREAWPCCGLRQWAQGPRLQRVADGTVGCNRRENSDVKRLTRTEGHMLWSLAVGFMVVP